jgi:hypothetical protein
MRVKLGRGELDSVPAGTAVAAVSRAANKLDVFAATFDGNIYTAAWDHFADSGQ